MLRQIWSRPILRWLVIFPVLGAVVLVSWASFDAVLTVTNTEEFCISCHEMRDTVYQEYRETIHAKNASGVRASCPDCHVPRHGIPKLWRKFLASNELYHKIMGTIDTPEKFEAARLELAQHVWAKMRETDSRECRSCHSLETMDLEKQDKRAARRHTLERKQEKGETCIDCHEGIAHNLPKDY